MLTQLILAVVGLIHGHVHVRADYGPYQQSPDYDAGAFGAWPTESYRSSPVIGPSLNVLQNSQFCADGPGPGQYTFLAPAGGVVRTPGPMVIDQAGHLVWTKQYGRTDAVDVHRFRDAPYLTFCVGRDFVAGYGDPATCYMLDSSYEEAYKIRGANGLAVDLREFHITRDDTAVITVSDLSLANLGSVFSPRDGWILDGRFQEIDIETGALLFQWQASQHFDVTESYAAVDDSGSAENPWDFFRITGVDKDASGNFLVSFDSMNSLAYISGRTGEVLWKLGGKSSMFEQDLASDEATLFSGPFHARFADADAGVDDRYTAITLFDRALDVPDPVSRGIYLVLDHERRTARVQTQYRSARGITTPQTGGSTQLLPSGNVLVSYGAAAAWTEFTADGTPLCEVHFGAEANFNDGRVATTRVTKHAWTGVPKTKPDLAVTGYSAAVSWNGATEVVSWVLEGSDSIRVTDANDKDEDGGFALLAAQPKSGFETVLSIPSSNTYPFLLRAVALDANGNTLSVSSALAWNPTPEEIEAATGGSHGGRVFLYFLTGFLSAAALGVCAWVARRRFPRRGVRLEVGLHGEEYERKRIGWVSNDEMFNGDESLSEDEAGLLGEEDDEGGEKEMHVYTTPVD